MKKIKVSEEELNMIQSFRNYQAQKEGAANASGNNGTNQINSSLSSAIDEKPRHRYQMQPVYRVIKKARQLFNKQMEKDTQAKKKCLKAALASYDDLYPDQLRFELDFRAERERLYDSKRFCDACKALELDPVNVADNVVFEGKGTLEKVLKEGLQVLGEQVHMFNAPIWEDTQSLYDTEHNKEVAHE